MMVGKAVDPDFIAHVEACECVGWLRVIGPEAPGPLGASASPCRDGEGEGEGEREGAGAGEGEGEGREASVGALVRSVAEVVEMAAPEAGLSTLVSTVPGLSSGPGAVTVRRASTDKSEGLAVVANAAQLDPSDFLVGGLKQRWIY